MLKWNKDSMKYMEACMIYSDVFDKTHKRITEGPADKRKSIAAWAGVWAAYYYLHGFAPFNPLLAWQLACALGAIRHMRPWGRGLTRDCRGGFGFAAYWRSSQDLEEGADD